MHFFFYRFCPSTHQTTFFNYVIGTSILIVLSRLANLHGIMRGMFPLQVIRYLRGSGVVERVNTGGEVGRWCWCRVRTSPPTQKKSHTRHNHVKMINIIRKCVPRQSHCAVHPFQRPFTGHQKWLLHFKLVSNYTACSHFNLISENGHSGLWWNQQLLSNPG